MFALGFSAGLPLLLVLGTLSFRLREAGIDRSTIGYLSWVGLAYGFKWVWAPLVDRLPLPPLTTVLGRRRGWLLLAQALVIAGPGRHGARRSAQRPRAAGVVRAAGGLRLGHARHRARCLPHRIGRTRKQAALAAAYQTGYRLAMIWAGAGVLWIAAGAEARRPVGLPGRRLALRLLRDGRLDGGGRGHGAVLARAGAPRHPARQEPRGLARRSADRALCRLHPPLPAGRPR